MSWSKFKFNCRFIAKQLPQVGNRKVVLDNLNQTKTVFLFNNENLSSKHQYLFGKLLKRDSDEELVRSATIYSELDFHSFTFDPALRKKYVNMQVYMTWLFLVYFMVATIYRTFVLPTFKDMYSAFDMSLPGYFIDFDIIWLVGSGLLASILSITFTVNFLIKRLDQYFIVIPKSTVFKLFMPSKIKDQIRLINQLYLSPLNEEKNQVTDSIKWIESYGLSVSEELNQLIVEQKTVLENYIEKRVSLLIGVLFTVIVILIFQLITAMYKPIFTMGELL